MLTILIDDLRNFRDGRNADIARTSAQGLQMLRSRRTEAIDELWLDHDLGLVDGEPDSIRPVVYELEEKAFFGEPYQIERIYVHTSNVVGGEQMVKGLRARGYQVTRVYAGDYFN